MELTNVLISASKYLGSTFCGKYIADNQFTTDEDVKQAKADYKARFTLHIEFDFTNVTADEMQRQLASTTSYAKMLYNNEFHDLVTNNQIDEIEALCAKGEYKCNVREMLDTRKTKSADPSARLNKDVKGMKDKGMSKDQIREQLEKQLAAYDD